jgi:hypothetical protein
MAIMTARWLEGCSCYVADLKSFIGGRGGMWKAFYVLLVLTLIYTTNQIDRLIVPQVKSQLEQDLGISEKVDPH